MLMNRRRVLMALCMAACAPHALAQSASSTINTLGGTHAINGYDPVAYFVAGAPQKGLLAVSVRHLGATWLFANEANRALFVASPEKYLPAFGGFCAFGVSRGYLVKVDPEAWSIIDGRLYLNYDPSIRAQWLKDVPGYIAKAQGNWPKLVP